MSFRTSPRGRTICWPTPDAVCLQGGCIHCPDYRARSWRQIYRYAVIHDMVKDYEYGRGYR